MGMSASQARFLSLTARKTNVEYEGQQINQQRTALSNESSNYYSQLTSMSVPVPPSTSDYTKISYTFPNGTVNGTITSLIATQATKNTGIYMLNYVESYPTQGMVVQGNNVITRTGEAGSYKYSIGNIELKEAENRDASEIIVNDENRKSVLASFVSAGIPASVASQMSNEELANKLIVENQYRALAEEKYSQSDWYVRYIKNSSTGNYEPVFYSKAEVENVNYNEKTGLSLSGIKAYVFGETTETREIKNAYAKVSQDSSGRYQNITIYDKMPVPTLSIEEVKELYPEWAEQEPDYNDFANSLDDPTLYNQYAAASRSCHINATSSVSGIGCYRHVLAHMLDLTLLNGYVDRSAYPKNYKSSISNGSYDVSVLASHIPSNISSNGQSPNMVPVSDAIRDGYEIDGVVYTVTTVPYTKTDSDADKYLSDYYIRQGNPTDAQKLLSNYYMDENGLITNKTLEQKCVDIFKALELFQAGTLKVDYMSVMVPVLNSINDDMKNFTLVDKEAYEKAEKEWMNNKPSPNEYEEGATYELTTITETDDAAYNDAMNQYYYDKAIYDQKVEEVNAKIGAIQVQDKNLELKLKQLDTEENAISTEMDAVKKVISKNVESSFKTFNA